MNWDLSKILDDDWFINRIENGGPLAIGLLMSLRLVEWVLRGMDEFDMALQALGD